MDAYWKLIISALVIIVSYFFGLLSKKTNIPSVIMLIFLGYGMKEAGEYFMGMHLELFPYLEVLGIVGVIMIVLEGALDLELSARKFRLILFSLITAIVLMGVCAVGLAFVFQAFIQNLDFGVALLYGLPFSILSSAIIIPSVENLPMVKKEFLVYESTFSDILGIMAFFFLLGGITTTSHVPASLMVPANILFTIVVSVVISLILILVMQRITTQLKLFLFVAILILLYSVGKLFHFSSLLMIFVFGLALVNPRLFFIGRLKALLDMKRVGVIAQEFRILTVESSFLLRTFFFVVFGASLSLSGLFDISVVLISCIALVIIYVTRMLFLRVVLKEFAKPEIWVAPRGLISVLLYLSIPADLQIPEFESEILFFIIIFSSLIMTWGLISYKKNREVEVATVDIVADES